MRAQSYTFDLMLAVTLIVVVATLVATFGFKTYQKPLTAKDVENLAGAIYEPFPKDWNESTVIIPGFVVNQRLNKTLLDRFNSTPDDTIRELLGIKSDFYINVSNVDGPVGDAGTPPPADAEIISVVVRHAAYQGTITRIEVMTWAK